MRMSKLEIRGTSHVLTKYGVLDYVEVAKLKKGDVYYNGGKWQVWEYAPTAIEGLIARFKNLVGMFWLESKPVGYSFEFEGDFYIVGQLAKGKKACIPLYRVSDYAFIDKNNLWNWIEKCFKGTIKELSDENCKEMQYEVNYNTF